MTTATTVAAAIVGASASVRRRTGSSTMRALRMAIASEMAMPTGARTHVREISVSRITNTGQWTRYSP